MLKGQDCVLLLKLLVRPENVNWSHRDLSAQLCISRSEISLSIKRLINANLLRNAIDESKQYPIRAAAEEFLIHAVKYCFSVKLGEFTCGMPTGIAAPVFKDKLVIGGDPVSVWPYGLGDEKGVALEPLYPSIPKALKEHPDPKFYELLALVDILRCGRAREKNIAIKMLKERINP